MAGWSIRSKLSLLAIIPMIALLIGGGLFATSIALDYRSAHTARGYADTLVPALKTANALGNEFVSPGTLSDPAKLQAARAASDDGIAALKPELEKLIDEKSDIAETAGGALAALNDVPGIRSRIDAYLADTSTTGGVKAGVINSQVRNTTTSTVDRIDQFIESVTGEIKGISPSEDTKNDAEVAQSLNQMLSAARDEQNLYAQTYLGRTEVNKDTYAADGTYIAQQNLAIRDALAVADSSQKVLLNQWRGEEGAIETWRIEWRSKLNLSDYNLDAKGNELPQPPISLDRANTWLAASNQHITTVTTAVDDVAAQTLSTARSSERDALIRAGVVGGAVVLTLVIVSFLLATIAKTVTGPLRRLRAGAVDIASVQLPAAVARIEQDGVAADVSLPPVLPADIAAGPETFEVARAVDDLGAEAVRLATAQVRLRRALDEAFVSMSRRSQSMVEKQLAIIDELESQEQDPDQLRNLFRLDHLAARMRRYNDNLLVLAGSAVRTRATAPVKVAELFRAATSEMEQYERVRLQPVSGASIAGTVAGELVHLLAELLDNAAMYSPPSSAIVLSAAFTADGGLQIEVLDAGVGISPGELDRLNARLTQPEAIDTQVPSRMGLFVVARLARRGGFGVMLQTRSDAAGTIALVRIPATLVVGAPGSTGEQPATPAAAAHRPPTPAVGSRTLPPTGFSSPSMPPPPAAAPAPAAAAAGAAAAAAAGIRAVDGSGTDAPALPKRRRGGGAALPPEVAAPAPGGGLFTPATPAGPGTTRRDDASTPAAAAAAGAKSPPTTSIQPSILRRSAPPETTPTGIPATSLRTGSPGIPAPNPAESSPPLARPGGGLPKRRPAATPSVAARPRSQPPLIPVEPQDHRVAEPQDHGVVDPQDHGVAEPHDEVEPQGVEPQDVEPQDVEPQDVEPPDPAPAQLSDPDDSAGPVSRASEPDPLDAPQDPLTTPSGEFRALPNPPVSIDALSGGGGGAPDAWDDALPTELAARVAAASSYPRTDPDAPMIGEYEPHQHEGEYTTPIFDQISVWFTAEPTGSLPVQPSSDDGAVDLREGEPGERQPSSRWNSLGDQRWLATNARAAAAPDTEGTTETGLPLRRPGANLLPSASSAAPAAPLGMPPAAAARPAPADNGIAVPSPTAMGNGTAPRPAVPEPPADADLVRGRLGSYQRGLANARKARSGQAPEPAFDPVGASLFTANSDASDEAGRNDEQGADQ